MKPRLFATDNGTRAESASHKYLRGYLREVHMIAASSKTFAVQPGENSLNC